MIAEQDRLPDADFVRIGPDGPETIALSELTRGRKIVLFAVPGAFTPTCDSAHMPSFVRSAEDLRSKGVDEIVCVSVNDAHVMRQWGEITGATGVGITLLADPEGVFTRALGLAYSNPAVGMINRSRRYAMVVDDGVVTMLHLEEAGQCTISRGEDILAAL